MALVTRLLDTFFRTLDAIDALRDRVSRLRTAAPRADQAAGWAPTAAAGEAPHGQAQQAPTSVATTSPRPTTRHTASRVAPKTPNSGAKRRAPATTLTKKAKATKSAAKASASGTSRKGSVDKKGAAFDSPRARAVFVELRQRQIPVVTSSATHDNKKVVARVLWALYAAQEVGSLQGLTAADTSALLHLAAGIEVFSTNIARACRDETGLFAEGEAQGRSKRYRLTAAGVAAAQGLHTDAFPAA